MKKLIEKTIKIPDQVQVKIEDNLVTVSQGQRNVEKKFKGSQFEIKQVGNEIKVISKTGKKKSLAVIKSISSEIESLFFGLKKDFEYKLEVVFSHFPVNVVVKEGFVEISNLAGAKMPKRAPIVGGTKVAIKGKEITVTSPNKDYAGQTAANIEMVTKVRGKDRRIFQDGIYITSKPAVQKME